MNLRCIISLGPVYTYWGLSSWLKKQITGLAVLTLNCCLVATGILILKDQLLLLDILKVRRSEQCRMFYLYILIWYRRMRLSASLRNLRDTTTHKVVFPLKLIRSETQDFLEKQKLSISYLSYHMCVYEFCSFKNKV